jgi:anti-sigma B factor antagonist
VFDMSDMDFISSAGLRVLIDVQKTCKRWNRGQLTLAAVPQRIYETLDLTGFVPLFNIFDDVLHAVGSF